MSMNMECYGLKYMADNEEKAASLLRLAVENGRRVPAYSGVYCNLHYGCLQIVAGGTADMNTGSPEIQSGHVHSAGTALWRCRVRRDITPEGSSELDMRLLVEPVSDGEIFTVIDLINADILPSYAPGEIIEMQVTAKPESVRFYRDRGAFARADEQNNLMPEGMNRVSVPLKEGYPMPLGFLSRHGINAGEESDTVPASEKDRLVYLRGTVLKRIWFRTDLPGKYGRPAVRNLGASLINTDFGRIHVMLNKEQNRMTEPGYTVSTLCSIQGDPLIGDYDEGMVIDRKNSLMALRYAFSSGRMKRLLPVLSKECAVLSEKGERIASGREETAAYLADRYRQIRNRGGGYALYGAADGCGREDAGTGPERKTTERCIIVGPGDEAEQNDLLYVFPDFDQKGMICSVRMSSEINCPPRRFRSWLEMEEDELVRKGISPAVLKKEKAFADYLNRTNERDIMTGVISSILDEKAVLEYGEYSCEGMNRVFEYLGGVSDAVSSEAGYTARPVLISRSPELGFNRKPADRKRAVALFSKLEDLVICFFVLKRNEKTGKVDAIRGVRGKDYTYIIDYYEEWDPVPETGKNRISGRE